MRKPQKAAAPKITRNATPVKRPEVGVLLQDWSTATTQTMKTRMAAAPRSFSHMVQASAKRQDQSALCEANRSLLRYRDTGRRRAR
ncbi:MAG: hypothetical protein DMG38_13605 [Acidobacteria bacterium]|nr:MAG: hypothetical protein DMG38_13605 [Acidobacteriota bacterium]